MNLGSLISHIKEKASYLCVGLDTHADQLPAHLKSHPRAVVEFNRGIIEATAPYCVAYKINTAFYECGGAKGWDDMEETLRLIPATHLKIADAKRGDIGNTSSRYAKAFFETLPFDAVTVAPYMGFDSIRPFLEHKDKFTIVLGLTSNEGSRDFQQQACGGRLLYETVLEKVSGWAGRDQLMFVVGATRADQLARVRQIVPDHFLLVPGIGAQGGSLAEVSRTGLTADGGLLVNVSRAVIHASDQEDFATAAGQVAQRYHTEMKGYLWSSGLFP